MEPIRLSDAVAQLNEFAESRPRGGWIRAVFEADRERFHLTPSLAKGRMPTLVGLRLSIHEEKPETADQWPFAEMVVAGGAPTPGADQRPAAVTLLQYGYEALYHAMPEHDRERFGDDDTFDEPYMKAFWKLLSEEHRRDVLDALDRAGALAEDNGDIVTLVPCWDGARYTGWLQLSWMRREWTGPPQWLVRTLERAGTVHGLPGLFDLLADTAVEYNEYGQPVR